MFVTDLLNGIEAQTNNLVIGSAGTESEQAGRRIGFQIRRQAGDLVRAGVR